MYVMHILSPHKLSPHKVSPGITLYVSSSLTVCVY